MSKLIYLMPLWSGCEDYLVMCLQVVQNKAARTVAKRNIFKPTRTLMKVSEVSQAATGPPQPCTPAEDPGQSDPSLPVQEVDS
jgi:hypothetical protein